MKGTCLSSVALSLSLWQRKNLGNDGVIMMDVRMLGFLTGKRPGRRRGVWCGRIEWKWKDGGGENDPYYFSPIKQ